MRPENVWIFSATVDEKFGAVYSGVIQQNIDSSEVLNRRFDNGGSSLLFRDVDIDEHQVGEAFND